MMATTEDNSEALAIQLAKMAHDHRCEQIVVLDLRGVSPITNFFVICTGTSDRQMRTTGEDMMVACKKDGDPPYGHSGLDSTSWVLIDFVTVVVHTFTPEHRAYYDLELLWGDAPRIEWTQEQHSAN